MFFGKVHISAISQNGSSWIKTFFGYLKIFFWSITCISFILFLERVPEILLLENGFQNPTLLWKTSIKAWYLSTMFYIIQVKYNYSLVPNRRPPRWVIFKNFSSQDILIPIPNSPSPPPPSPPPAIISWKKFHQTQAK